MWMWRKGEEGSDLGPRAAPLHRLIERRGAGGDRTMPAGDKGVGKRAEVSRSRAATCPAQRTTESWRQMAAMRSPGQLVFDLPSFSFGDGTSSAASETFIVSVSTVSDILIAKSYWEMLANTENLKEMEISAAVQTHTMDVIGEDTAGGHFGPERSNSFTLQRLSPLGTEKQ
ncbi:hypothetical protein F7725_008975 [Dissostichus mawsoni]|uniref:Uncharacterized protein n=1 Tax=Dissostichus mawsoni TaxID=36200 RepID=A0A7J5Z661_DISMA|nr:hypothetical protein F7725_008975 [Dissostichus mawsoni]